MTVEEAVRVRVASLAPVVALVGTRVYLDKLPQHPTLPAVRVQLVDDPLTYHLRGPDGLRRSRVQVDAVAEETSGVDPYAAVETLAAAIDGDGLGTSATGLSGWVGAVAGSPGLQITGIFRVVRLRRYDPEELRVITMMQDYFVNWIAA